MKGRILKHKLFAKPVGNHTKTSFPLCIATIEKICSFLKDRFGFPSLFIAYNRAAEKLLQVAITNNLKYSGLY